jgi:hypothetical protein
LACYWHRQQPAPPPISPSPLLSPSEKLIESTLALSVKMDELTKLLKSRMEAMQDPMIAVTLYQMQAQKLGETVARLIQQYLIPVAKKTRKK